MIEVVGVNTKDPSNAYLKQRYGITGVPTMVLVSGDVEVARHKGAMASHAQIRDWVSKFQQGVK